MGPGPFGEHLGADLSVWVPCGSVRVEPGAAAGASYRLPKPLVRNAG
jgi:hypothetical protein